ncbi:cache domain-containing sensor histidine kinase [Paenibacillus sp. YIM B09110]|uniref:cache domain-containing sensor histidine kinase n=1 Tax=Paenibacillus sp. YIM B09110 TaxID=3126102 RepID=UPI00301BC01D
MTKWIQDMSLKKKLLILFAVVGIVPLIITFFISYSELHKSIMSGQNYSANRNYEQTMSALSSKFAHIEEISSMIIVNKDINIILSVKPGSMEVPQQLAVFDNIHSYTRILESNTELEKIFYFVDDEFAVTGPDALFRPITSISDMDWARKIKANGGAPTWVLYQADSLLDKNKYLMLGRLLWNPHNFQDAVGIVSINLDLGQIGQNLTKSVPEQLVYLETADGELIASSGEMELERMRLPYPIVSGNQFVEIELDSGTYLARGQMIGNTNLRLVSVMSYKAATEAVNHVRSQLILVYAVISVLLLVFIVMVTKSITRRIFLLMNKMSQVRQGRLNPLDIAPRDDEIGQLVSSYNYMINSVQELMEEQFRSGQEKKGAELKALQSQINPHFLYNTLDMLNWMAQKGERENIQQIVYALSDYYKLILNKGEDFVTVEDELRLSSIYVEIQKKRFKNRIRFEIDVEEGSLSCMIPKITLQPLVENAIVHGIAEKTDGSGVITIQGRVIADRLVLTIEDDGVGMNSQSEERRSNHSGSGYGVSNIEKRLELYFGGANGLAFNSTEGEGTRVTIDVPVVKR